jgi:hypothetical protein
MKLKNSPGEFVAFSGRKKKVLTENKKTAA